MPKGLCLTASNPRGPTTSILAGMWVESGAKASPSGSASAQGEEDHSQDTGVGELLALLHFFTANSVVPSFFWHVWASGIWLGPTRGRVCRFVSCQAKTTAACFSTASQHEVAAMCRACTTMDYGRNRSS